MLEHHCNLPCRLDRLVRVKAYLIPDGFVLHHVSKLAGKILREIPQVSHDVVTGITTKAFQTHADIFALVADLTAA